MKSYSLKRIVVINTLSNYLDLIVRLGTSIVLTRLLFIRLGLNDYGLWVLLWSIFGYSLLLDFGFGVAVQKATSESVATNNWDTFNETISSIFVMYLGLSGLIVIVSLLMAFNVAGLFHLTDPGIIHYYQKAFLGFGLMSACLFPFGFFAEILAGLKRIFIKNFIDSAILIINFILVYIALAFGYKVLMLTAITGFTTISLYLFIYLYLRRVLPHFNLDVRLFNRRILPKVASFSLFSYLITCSNLIIYRTDQIVISMCNSVSSVGLYQASLRITDIFQQFSTQFQKNLSPIAAEMYIKEEHSRLVNVLIQSTRFSGLVATLMFVPLVFYIKPILMIWLNLDNVVSVICGVVLLISAYFFVVVRNTMSNILLMCNQHKQLSYAALTEGVLNLVLSIILIRLLGLPGVAIGTLIPNVCVGLFFNIPQTLRFLKIPLHQYFIQALSCNFIFLVVGIMIVFPMYHFFYPSTIWVLLIHIFVYSTIFLALYYRFGLKQDEQIRINQFVSHYLRVVLQSTRFSK